MSNVEDNKETPSDSKHSLVNAIDAFTKFSGIAIALLYFAGLVIVNAHYSRYGIAKISLVNSKYVIAGAWYAVFAATCYMIYWEISKLFDKKLPLRAVLAIGILAFAHLVTIYMLLNFVADRGELLSARLGFQTPIAVALVIVTIVALVFQIVAKRSERWQGLEVLAYWAFAAVQSMLSLMLFNAGELVFLLTIFAVIRLSIATYKAYEKKGGIAEVFGSFFIALLFSFWLFGRYVYAEIYPAFGGGNFVPVELKLKDEASEKLKIHSLQGKLIDRTDTGFVIAIDSLQSVRAIELSAESVLMVSYTTDYFETPSMSKLMKWIEKKSMKTQIDSIHSASSIDSTSSKK